MDENDNQMKLFFLLNTNFKFIPKSYVKFRSYLNVYSSILASNSGLKLPKFFTSENISCPVCFTPWQFNSHSFKLLPSTGKKFKIDVNSNVTDGKILKFKEFKRNGLLRLTKNKLVLNCLVCTKKSTFSFVKPLKAKYKTENEKNQSDAKKKKKKKKKNPCANLNLKACKEAQMKISSDKKRKKEKSSSFGSAQENNKVSSLNNSSSSIFQMKNQNSSITKAKPINSKGNQQLSQTVNKTVNKRPLKCTKYGHTKNYKKNVKQLVTLKKAIKEKKTFSRSSLKSFLNVISK